jgi:MFS family permease
MAVSTLVNTIGSGALLTTFALYFTRIVHLTPAQVGIALSAAALVGLVVQLPVGHLSDTRGPRELLRLLFIAAGVCALGLTVARNVWMLVIVLSLEAVFDNGARAVRGGVIARLAAGGPGGQAAQFRAYLRSMTNVGISLGALFGGLALAVDKPWAYLSVFVLDAATWIATGLLTGRLPHLPPSPPPPRGQPRLQVLRDVPYVVVSVLMAVYTMHFLVIELALPLWLVRYTSAPRSLVAALVLINTVAVALFQVRLSRGTDRVRPAARAMLVGSLWIAAGFTLTAFASERARPLAVALLCAGALVHVVGEMIGSGGQWGVQMGLAPLERQGQYQGFAGMSFSLANVLAPSLIVALCIQWGRPGWLVLGGLVVAAGVLSIPASAWALRTRERYGVHTHAG